MVSRGPRGARGWAEGFLAAVPDLVVDVVAEYVSDGDEVVERLMSGTHRGEFDGLSPTGRRLQVRGVSVPRTGSPASFVLGLLEHRDGAPPTGGDLTSGQVSGRIFTTSFASVYAHYATKVEKKGRTTAELIR